MDLGLYPYSRPSCIQQLNDEQTERTGLTNYAVSDMFESCNCLSAPTFLGISPFMRLKDVTIMLKEYKRADAFSARHIVSCSFDGIPSRIMVVFLRTKKVTNVPHSGQNSTREIFAQKVLITASSTHLSSNIKPPAIKTGFTKNFLLVRFSMV